MISFTDFEKLVERNIHTNDLRYGQIVMNTLYDVRPEKYSEVVGTNMDCFYDTNDKVARVLEYLRQTWIDE